MRGGQSSARLPGLRPDRLDAEQRGVYDAITGGRRADGPQLVPLFDDDGCLLGPFNAMLVSPPVGAALPRLGVAVRFETKLSDRQRGLAILVVASPWRSEVERAAHEVIGRHVGLTDAELDAALGNSTVALDDPHEATTVAFTRSLVTAGQVDDDKYALAVSALGLRAVYELTALVGYYSALALQLRVFGTDR